MVASVLVKVNDYVFDPVVVSISGWESVSEMDARRDEFAMVAKNAGLDPLQEARLLERMEIEHRENIRGQFTWLGRTMDAHPILTVCVCLGLSTGAAGHAIWKFTRAS